MLNSQVLTRRETEVMGLVIQGDQNKGIARKLGISENTVESHLKHIYEKLNARSRIQAALIYVGRWNITVTRD